MKRLLVGIFSLVPFLAYSAQVYLVGIPTAWRLQDYVPGTVIVYFSGSSCAAGAIQLPASATVADVNRLYATVNAAKNLGTKVFVYYDNADPNCSISSFGVPEQ
jgi:hypothetical protein